MPVLEMQQGPQTLAAKSPANIIVFGGQAGGGKSYWLLLKALILSLTYPGLQAIIFRRTRPELKKPGGLWHESQEIYRPFGFIPREGGYLDWRHPNGSIVKLDHMQLEKNKFDHQGPSYHFVGFDEAPHFSEGMVTYLYGRLRGGPLHIDGTHRMSPTLALTANPDPDSFLKKWIRWWLDDNGQYADPDKIGKLRWFLKVGDEFIFADKPEDLPREDIYDTPRSMTFIPSKLSDNKILQEIDPAYRSRLRAQLSHVRAALEKGDWTAKALAGSYFQRGWFRPWGRTEMERKVLGQPSIKDLVGVCRAWDFAATPVLGDTVAGIERPAGFIALPPQDTDPDWTRGVKVGRFKNGDMVVLDMVSCRDTPGAVDVLLERTAEDDGPRSIIHIPQDPAQAGKDQFDRRQKQLRRFARVEGRPRMKNKEFYAKNCAKFCFSGRMWYAQDNRWNLTFFNEIEQFPPNKDEAHDDVVDSFSDAFDLLDTLPYQYGYEQVKDNERMDANTDVNVTARFRDRKLI